MVSRPKSAAALKLVRQEAASERKSGHAPPLDDTELLAALRRGDATAARALYTRARPQVDRTILSLLRRRGADHEDLAQLAMISLVGSIRNFRGDCSLDTWTARITARAVYKELRRRRSEGRLLASVQEIDGPQSEGVDLERQLGARSVMVRVQKHLDAMDPMKAWTVLLHDVCGYDLREIAEITDSSVAAAQSRLVRARADLHARLEGDPGLRSALESRESGR